MTKPSEALSTLAEALLSLERRTLVVVTGAGVSQASGVTTFRGSEPDAVWKVSDVEMATARFLYEDPVEQWLWYLERFSSIDRARPNAGHRALADLERWCDQRGGGYLLVTQNIDSLHEESGSQNLIKVHGTADRARCARSSCALGAPSGSLARAGLDFESFIAAPSFETLPKCPECESFLRAHVLFFDEFYTEHEDYRFPEVQRSALDAGVLLFVGTSFSVGVTDLFLRQGEIHRIPMFSLDPNPSPPPSHQVTMIRERSETALPQLLEILSRAG